jgi:hypothetical protein
VASLGSRGGDRRSSTSAKRDNTGEALDRDYIDRINRLSKKYPDALECLRTPPVYLGEYYHAVRSITSTQMLKHIRQAREWTKSTYSTHPCRRYFEPRPFGQGYQARAGFELSVDHINPDKLGGLDHPRNYLLMAKRLNSSFNCRDLPEKFNLLNRHQQVLVRAFAQRAKKAAARVTEQWLAQLERPGTAKSEVILH